MVWGLGYVSRNGIFQKDDNKWPDAGPQTVAMLDKTAIANAFVCHLPNRTLNLFT
jgi:hypothetical protein